MIPEAATTRPPDNRPPTKPPAKPTTPPKGDK